MPESAARAVEHPLNERVAGQYMSAPHRARRSAEALEHYRSLRERLVAELGVDPGAALVELHRRILVADPVLVAVHMAPVAIPRLLPAVPASFVGRHDELERLDSALRAEEAVIVQPSGDVRSWSVERCGQVDDDRRARRAGPAGRGRSHTRG